jgi:hypothetical protein
VSVTYDPDAVDAGVIAEAVEEAGYPVNRAG